MIDTQAIRSKILDLAMRGQLTEQLPADGSAEELYQRIQKEKEALIAKKKIKKEKILPSVTKDEEPYSIPHNWRWSRIGSIVTLQAGKNIAANRIKNTQKDEYQIPCFGGNGQRGFVDSANTYGYHAIIGRQGALCGNVNFAQGPFYATEHAVVVYEYANLNMDWIGIALHFLNLNQYATSVAQPGLAVGKINKVLIPLPPLEEQKRIVEKIHQAFSVLDTIDELQKQYANNLSALKSKLIDAAVQGKLTEQLPEDGTAEELYQQILADRKEKVKAGQIKKEKPVVDVCDEPYEIPLTWKWVRLGDIASVLGGKRIPAGRSLTHEDTGHKYIRVSEMKNRTVITDSLLYVPDDIYLSISQYIINKEDVYITVAGTIGRVGKIPTEIDGSNLTENADRIVFSILDQDWLIICLSSSQVQKQIERLTTSVAQPKLAIKRIREFMIPMPPLAEQKRIVARLNEVLKKIEA